MIQMNRIVRVFLIIFGAGVIGLGIKVCIDKDSKISNSKRFNNEEVSTIIEDYANRYQHSFTLASADTEEQLYGVWQARGYAGHTRSSRYQWDGLWGDVVIFCENAMIYGGTPYLEPVYASYESCTEDMETDAFLDLKWKDGQYAGRDGTVILAVGKGKDGEPDRGMPYRFILMENCLMIERGGSYFVMEKVGRMKPYDEDAVRNGLIQTEATDRHSFTPMTTEMEQELYGVWQIKECVGITEETDSRGEGMVGDVILFSEDAWISSGIPSLKPMYVCYDTDAKVVKTDEFLGNIVWLDGLGADWNGMVIAGIETEKNVKYGSAHQQDEPLKMIMTDDSLIIERGGLYFKTQKVGEVEWYQNLLNVEPY